MSRTDTLFAFEPGDTLLLFTDGLIERRHEAISAGFDRLTAALAGAPADAEAICDHVLGLTLGQDASEDDLAVLAVRFLPVEAGGLELTVPARPDSVSLVRHRLRAWLAHAVPELDPMTRADLELASSEAASNVVRHAYGPEDATYCVTVGLKGQAVELRISDRGRWRQPRGRHGGRGLSLMRALVDEFQIDQRPNGTTVTMRRRLSGPGSATPPSPH
jgi:anti-sigma regulatory factor (Ser/Thr protein kinase)